MLRKGAASPATASSRSTAISITCPTSPDGELLPPRAFGEYSSGADMGHRRLTDSEWVPQVSNRPLGGKCAVGERLTQSGAGVRRHSCMPSLALALLATLGSATAMADPLTCHGWLNANDSAVDNPYNATLIQLMPPDMPKEQVITRFIPELVRGCLEHAQLGFTSAVKQVLIALDAPEPQVQKVAPEPPASEVMATEPPDFKAVAPEPPTPSPHPIRKPHQSSHKSRKPSQGHVIKHDRGVHTRPEPNGG